MVMTTDVVRASLLGQLQSFFRDPVIYVNGPVPVLDHEIIDELPAFSTP
jgi:hypothetical protein